MADKNINVPRNDAASLSVPVTEQPIGYVTGRIVAIVEANCNVPPTFSALVADDGSKLLYWLKEALREAKDNTELVELADIFYAHEREILQRISTNEVAGRYWVGYYHQKSRMANQSARRKIGALIKEARAEQGLAIRDLAEKSGVDKSQISRIEAGRANVTIDTINSLAVALGLKITIG